MSYSFNFQMEFWILDHWYAVALFKAASALLRGPTTYLQKYVQRVVPTISAEDKTYRKVANSNMSRLEAHAGFFRLLMKGIFDPYVLWTFDTKLIF